MTTDLGELAVEIGAGSGDRGLHCDGVQSCAGGTVAGRVSPWTPRSTVDRDGTSISAVGVSMDGQRPTAIGVRLDTVRVVAVGTACCNQRGGVRGSGRRRLRVGAQARTVAVECAIVAEVEVACGTLFEYQTRGGHLRRDGCVSVGQRHGTESGLKGLPPHSSSLAHSDRSWARTARSRFVAAHGCWRGGKAARDT